MRLGPLTVTTVLLVLWPCDVRANPYLDEARALMERLLFPEATQRLEAALLVPSNEPGEKVVILELLARCQVARGDRSGAEATYTQLLSLAPHYELEPNLSPKIVAAFDAAKAQLFPPGHVVLTKLVSVPGAPRVALIDPWRQVRAVVLVSRGAVGGWQAEQGQRMGETFSFSTGAANDREWFIEARGESGEALASIGSADAPENALKTHTVQQLPPRSDPVTQPVVKQLAAKQVLTWVAVGAGVLAAAGGTYLQVRAVDSAARARHEAWADTARERQAEAQAQAVWGTVLLAGAGACGVAVGALLVW